MPESRKYEVRRMEEDGIDIPPELLRENLNYVEGIEKLNVRRFFSTGEYLQATEEDGKAELVIIRNGKEVFNFKDLLPEGYKFVTPSYWLSLGAGNPEAPKEFREDPEAYKKIVQGQWTSGKGFVSIGSINSTKDIFALLHEIGHSKKDRSESREFSAMTVEEDKKNAAGFFSKRERAAWADALKSVRKINRDLKMDILEDFSGPDDIKKYIYTSLSSHRYSAELKSSGLIEACMLELGLKSTGKNKDWLDNLFDKRKLIKKN